MAQRGWRRLPPSHPAYSPTKRLYFDPANRIRSRRAYENHRLQLQGWESKSDFDRRFKSRRDRGYARWLDAASSNLDVPDKELRKAGSDFNRLFLAARDDDFPNDPDGTFAEFLTFIGLRNPASDSPIGDGETGMA